MKVVMYLTKCRDYDIEDCILPRESLLRKPRHKTNKINKKKSRVRLGLCDDFAKYIMKKIKETR